MPWQVPITVDGLEYPVTFNTEEQPTQQDLDEAVQQILSQRGQALQPAQPAGETPGYLSQLGSALGLGYRQMKSGVGATFNALTGDTEDVAAEMAEQAKLQREQQAAQTPQDIEFMRRLDEAEKAYELASGPVETISALSQYPAAAFAEPGAAFKTAVQSAPNVLISGATSLAGYGLGGLVGGAATLETGPGAILGGLAGAAAGGALSNTLMEAGPSIFDALNEKTNGAAANMTAEQISAFLKANPDVIEQGLKTGAIRGSVIGAVEALGVKGSGRLLTMPERAAARAAQKTLVDAGVDVTSKKAVDAALLDPTIRSATKTAAEAAKNQFSSAGNLARMAGASAIETGAAGAGELAAQAAAGQDISTKEAFMEMLGESALSAPMAAATKAVEGANYALTPSQEAEQPEATQAEPTVVSTVEEPPSMLPFTREDIRATQLPFGREDIRATELPFSRQNIRGLSMIQPEIAIAQNAIAATQNVPFTDITDKAATNIAEENARIASQLAIQSQQAAKKAGAEVTPLSEGAVSTGAGLNLESALIAKQERESSGGTTGAWKPVAEDEPPVQSGFVRFYHAGDPVISKGDRRWLSPDRAWVSGFRPGLPVSFVDVPVSDPQLKKSFDDSGTPMSSPFVNFEADEQTTAKLQPLSAGLRATIPPSLPETGPPVVDKEAPAGTPVQAAPIQPVETQEDAAIQREIPENRVEERIQIDEGGPTAETSGGNRPVVSGEVQEEVITPPGEPTTATEGMVTPGGVASPNLPDLIAVRDNLATPEQIQSLSNKGLVEVIDGQNVITEAGVAQMPEDQRPTLTPDEGREEVEGMAAPVFTRNEIIVSKPSVSRRSRPNGVDGESITEIKAPSKVSSPDNWNRLGDIEKLDATVEARLDFATGKVPKKTDKSWTTFAGRKTKAGRSVLARNVTYNEAIEAAKDFVESANFQPQTTAAETQTPVPLRGGTGAAGVASSSLGGGRSPELTQVSPETETTSSEKLDPKLIEAERKQTKEEEAAVKQQEKLDQDTKSSLNSVVGPQKKDPVVGTVTKVDVETAREALTNSGEIPNAYLTNVYESREAFLADKANARLFPASYARLQNEKNIEGLYENGQTLIFAKQIQVSDLDRGLAKMLGVSDEQAAARRVIAHENGHRAISLFTMAEKRELRGYLMRAYSDEQIAKLVEKYTEYADWRTNPESRFEALEELLMRDFERMEEIPTGGVWDDIVQFLKRVWRRLTGQKGEPKLKELKDVVRLMRNAMKRPAVPLGSYTLKDGGQVKLSYAGEKAIENLPEERRQFMRDSLETAKAMAAAGKSSEEIRSVTGWFPGKYDGKMRWEVPDEGASMRLDAYRKERNGGSTPEEIVRSFFAKRQADEQRNALALVRGMPKDELLKFSRAFTERQKQENANLYAFFVRGDNKDRGRVPMGFLLDHPTLFESYPDLWWTPVSFNAEDVGFESSGQANADGSIGLNPVVSFEDENQTLSTLLHEIQHIIQNKEGFAKGSSVERAAGRQGWDYYDEGQAIRDYQRTAGEIEARDVQARQKLTPEQRAATAPYSSENIAPEDAIVLFGSGSQASVQFSSETSAAFTAGSEAARSTLYSERDMDIREAIRRAYEAMPKTNSVAVPIGELFAKTEELMPGVTQDEFSNVLQDLFEDNGAVLQEGESDFFVTTPEGRRAGFVVVMPRAAKASKIPIEDAVDVSKSFKADLAEAGRGRVDTKAKFKGKLLKDTEIPEHNVKSYPLYRNGAIKLIDDLMAKTNDILAVAESLQDPEFQMAVGLQVSNDVSSEMITIARSQIGFDIGRRLTDAIKNEKNPRRKRELELAKKKGIIYYNAGTGAGQALQNRQESMDDPLYKGQIIFDQAELQKDKKAKEKLDAITGGTEKITDIITGAEQKAAEETTQAEVEAQESAAEDDEYAKLVSEGEEGLEGRRKTIWERAKMILRRLAMYARADKMDIKTGSKASLSAEQRRELDELNAILRMPKEERDKAREKDLAEFDALMAEFLGLDSEAKTPEQKKTRQKREKMVNTAKKRAESGKDIEKPQEGESESSEEQVSKAERTAQAILKDLSERYSDPLIIKEKKPNVDAMRELYKDRVKQGVGPNQMTEKSFISKAVELGADEKTAGILWKAAELEIDAREAMRQDKILQRKAAVGARADAQAHRIIFAKERLKRQSGFTGIDTNPNKDTIIQAFRDQVKSPVSIEDFVARLKSLNVSETVAKRLFTAAEREKADLEAMEAFRMLEGPDALKRMLREMNKARPADSVPLERAMPWRKILSSKPKDVAEYRQRILEAVSSIESFQNLTEEQKERLADLYAEAWEERRQAILDRMLRDEIKKARDRDEISDDVEKKLQQSRNKILEIINLGGFNNDDLVKILGERYGISTSFTEEQKARIQKLADQLQDEDMNTAKRNKLAMQFAIELAGAMDVPVTEIIANWWTSSVLFGPQTIFSIGAAFLNGGYSIATIGIRRSLARLTKGDVQGALEESILMLKGFSRYLGAFKQAGRRAWGYLWTGDVGLLGIGSNDILSEISNFEQLQKFQRHKLLAEQLAKDPKMARRYVGMYLRFVSRLLTALDAFNVMVTKAATASLALRMSGMSTENIIKAEKMLNLKAYKDQVIRDYFDNKAPRTPYEKGLVDSYAEAEMYRAIDKMGGKMENADYLASESAMTMHPTGFGGVIYDAITGFFAQRQSNADEYLEKMKKDWVTRKDLTSVTFLALAYLRQFAAYNAAGLTGSKFVRYASNKFNQGLSFIPFAGLLRQLEAKDDRIKGKDAFIETIYRNQVIGALMLFIGGAVLGAIEDEPDDEERGTFWNGGWANLTPDQKKQLLAKGQKEYTMGFKYNGRWYVFNYQNWPLNQMLSAIGSMSDQIRFSPKQWNEKNLLSKTVAGMVSGVKSTLEIPALSGLQELVGNRLASKDPTEQSLDRISRVASGWVGGFVPRILKDIDFATQPELRKYETLWEKTASHIPIYRRYVGEEYYDILGKPIKRNVIPGSREFMMGPTEPEYKILGALNSRNIFLTPANAEYRMVGKGRNRRRLTQEEADAYSLETGKGYRQMLLRYGQRALQMPTERARAFLSDKADEVRDRALKKVYRGYTK